MRVLVFKKKKLLLSLHNNSYIWPSEKVYFLYVCYLFFVLYFVLISGFPLPLLLSHALPVRHSLLRRGWDQIMECSLLQDRMAACCLISLQGIEWQGMKPSEKGLQNLKPVARGYRECSKAVVYLKIYQISSCKCQIQCIYLKGSIFNHEFTYHPYCFKKKQDAGCLPIFAFINFLNKVSQILVSNTNAGIAATFFKIKRQKIAQC